MGPWIEMKKDTTVISKFQVGPRMGPWIEIALKIPSLCMMTGRASHGARGWKYSRRHRLRPCTVSGLAWGLWIEIEIWHTVLKWWIVGPRMGLVD